MANKKNPKNRRQQPSNGTPPPSAPIALDNPAAYDPGPIVNPRNGTTVLMRYPELRRLFLKHLSRYGNITAAAHHIRVSVETVETFRRAHPWFQAQMDEAHQAHTALIEQTIHSRAIDGWLEPRFGKFGVQGHVRRFSDALLIAYAKRHVKEYREGDVQRTEVSGVVNHQHAVAADQLTPEQREALRKLLGDPEEVKPAQITLSEPSANGKHAPSTNGVHRNGTNGTH
jgi:hypothetical protein